MGQMSQNVKEIRESRPIFLNPEMAKREDMGEANSHAAKEASQAEFLTTAEAASRVNVTSATIRNWCVQYKIGKRHGHRWLVYPDRLIRLVEVLQPHLLEQPDDDEEPWSPPAPKHARRA